MILFPIPKLDRTVGISSLYSKKTAVELSWSDKSLDVAKSS